MIRMMALAAVLVLLSACNDDVPDADVEHNRRLVGQIADDLRSPGGRFDEFEATYNDNTTDPQSVGYSVNCAACDPERLMTQLVRATWRSEVTPIKSISVWVDQTTEGSYESVQYTLPDDEDELTELYGERPVDSGPADG